MDEGGGVEPAGAQDPQRIANDLHDGVIQRLFAAGMTVQATIGLVNDDAVVGRLREVVEQLDTAIADLREVIARLEAR